jgi:RsiW-degrading membrane proteinase PrsW (M82 family)
MLQSTVAFTVGLSVVLSLLPVIIWGAIFLSKSNEKRYMVVRTFMLGALMVVPLVAYRALWDTFPSIDLYKNLKPLQSISIGLGTLTLNYIILYLSIGVIEEVSKYFVVRRVDAKEINSVRDSIEFSIIAALGFSFAENTFYFIQIQQNFGMDMLLNVFIFR